MPTPTLMPRHSSGARGCGSATSGELRLVRAL
jgi:hypothetical protein